MNSPSQCFECRRPVPDGLGGLCPHCLWGDSVPAPDGRELIQGHVLDRELARGGMGIVYLARQLSPERSVALKMLRPHLLEQPAMRDRFRQEAQAAAGLQHPGILPVYQVGGSEELPWFTMMLAEGGTLLGRRAGYQGKWRETATLMAGLARAVGHAHDFGVLHRDLKPGNILFDAADRAYVCDFGLAKVATAGETPPDWTLSVQLLGTPHYMSPEIAAGNLKQATTSGDIYALGVMLYELLAGHLPFQAENVPALLRKIADEEPTAPGTRPSPAVPASSQSLVPLCRPPADLAAIAMRCLDKSPARRYPKASALADDLDAWLAGKPVTARPLSTGQKVRRWVQRNPVVAALLTALVLAITAGGLVGWHRQRALLHALAASRLSGASYQRQGGKDGRRFAVLETLRQVSGLVPPVDLRTQVAAALATPDLRPQEQWPVYLPDFVSRFDFSPDLTRCAVAVPEGGVAVLDTTTRLPVRSFPQQKGPMIYATLFSPDGNWLGFVSGDGRVEIHSLSDTPGASHVITGQQGERSRLSFSPDSRSALILVRPQAGVLLDLATGAQRAMVWPASSSGSPAHASFSPDGQYLALHRGKELQVVRTADLSMVWSATHDYMTGAPGWSPDGGLIAVSEGAQPGVILMHDAATGALSRMETPSHGKIQDILFHPDGQSLVFSSWDSRVVWMSLSRDGPTPVELPGITTALRLSRDGHRMGYSPKLNTLGLAELTASPVLQHWPAPPAQFSQAFVATTSPDGRWLVVSEMFGLRFYDTRAGRETAWVPLDQRQYWRSAVFSGDGSSLLSNAPGQLLCKIPLQTGKDGRLVLGTPAMLEETGNHNLQERAPNGVDFVVARRNNLLHNSREDTEILLWPDGDPARARTLIPPGQQMLGFRLIPGTPWGVSDSLLDPDITVWDTRTGKLSRTLGLPEKASCDIAMDGRHLVTISGGEHRLWDTSTWQVTAHWPAATGINAARLLCFFPDGRKVLTSSGTEGLLEIRSVPGGDLLATLSPCGIFFPILLTFRPDGQRLYILTDRRQIIEWELEALEKAWAMAGVPLK